MHPAHINEDTLPGEDPVAYVTRLAREKAQAVFDALRANPALAGSSAEEPLLVLGADTTVTFDAHILGKPEDRGDAARMLRLLSGRSHQVATGIALVSTEKCEAVAEITTVYFETLTDAEIDAYIATNEPMDKAGAYAIQGRAARWIPRIDGCYFNVVGLPLARLTTLLAGFSAIGTRAETQK